MTVGGKNQHGAPNHRRENVGSVHTSPTPVDGSEEEEKLEYFIQSPQTNWRKIDISAKGKAIYTLQENTQS